MDLTLSVCVSFFTCIVAETSASTEIQRHFLTNAFCYLRMYVLYNMHQDTKSARLVAMCKHSFSNVPYHQAMYPTIKLIMYNIAKYLQPTIKLILYNIVKYLQPTIKLILYNIVKYLQQEEDKVVVGSSRKEKPRSRKSLKGKQTCLQKFVIIIKYDKNGHLQCNHRQLKGSDWKRQPKVSGHS